MKINCLYKDKNDINIDSYLKYHGIDNSDMFLNPENYNENDLIVEDFNHYKNMEEATSLMMEHIKTNHSLENPIYIIVDCDADGYTSASELYLYLKKINTNINIEFIIHETKIHGLNDEKIYKYLISKEPSLLIIPDANGTEEQYKELKELQWDILVLDHHETEESNYAIVVNNIISPNVLNKDASGSIVVHQFLRALDSKLGIKYASQFTDLAMCGCVGDVMALNNYYNRTYFYYGSRFIKNKFLKILFDKFVGEITPHNISFMLVPKINAVVRSDDYNLKIDLFKAFIGIEDGEEIAKKCKKCHDLQRENVKEISKNIYENADINKKIVVERYDKMIPSYTGLIAGKISGDLNKPCVIVQKREEGFIGSMRSPIPIRETFEKSDSVEWCRGHDVSAGILINNIDNFKNYCSTLDLTKDNVVNVTYAFNDVYSIPDRLFGYFDKYEEIWGKNIEKPLFYIGNIRINSKDILLMGKNKNTLKFKYKGVDFLIFYANNEVKNDFFINMDKYIIVNVLGCLSVNSWKNNRYNQFIIEKYETRREGDLSIEDVF